MTANKLAAWYVKNHKTARAKSINEAEYRTTPGKKLRAAGLILERPGTFWLPLLFLLSGCLAAPVKLPVSAIPKLRTVLVVPVESPPLEVFPDLLETRIPAFRHYNNMELPVFQEEKIYRNPGEILIAGLAAPEDILAETSLPDNTKASDKGERLKPLIAQSSDWMPTFVLSAEAASQLNSNQIKAISNGQFLGLSIALRDRNANLGNWRKAIERWYGRDTTLVDYRHLEIGPVDAVLEIGIRQYTIFDAQTSLQVLIKLIDPGTGQVIARTSVGSRSVEASAQTLLAHDGAKFKSLISEIGARLVDRGFHDIGLTPAARL